MTAVLLLHKREAGLGLSSFVLFNVSAIFLAPIHPDFHILQWEIKKFVILRGGKKWLLFTIRQLFPITAMY